MSNTLRLLRLPEEVQQLLQHRKLSEGHARALLALSDPKDMTRLGKAVRCRRVVGARPRGLNQG